MRVLIFVWFLRAWAKPGLTAHPATGHQEILVSASGQAVMRREAKEAAESSLDEQSVVERALNRAAELSRKGSPEEALYRESLLKKVRDILEHDGAKPAGLQQREARRGARNDPVHHDVHGGVDEHGMMWHGEPYMDSVHHYDDALHGDHVHADHMADWTHEHLAAHGTEHDAMMHDPYHGHESFDMTLQPTDHGIFPHMGDEHDMQDLHLPADHLQLTDAIKESDKAGIEAAEAAIKMGLPSKKVAEVAAKAAKAAAEAEGMTEEQQATVAKDAAEKAQWMGEDLGSVEHLEQMKQLFEHGHHEVSDHSHHIDSMEHIDHLEHPLEGGEHPMDDFEQMDHMGHDTHVEHPEVMSFSLQGCSKELCDAMKGSYHETGWKDGRPIYSKDDHEVSVFFADRGAMSGWWFGKSPHSEEAYAFHPGKEPLPPSSGWHVPPEGGIDESMRFLSAVQEVHHLHYEPEEPVVNLTGPVEVKDAPMGDEVVSTLPPSTGLEEMPVLQVLGCKDARTAALVDGLYEAAGITNGLPWFKKHGAEGSVWLYHYADVAAGSVGWWIGSNPAGRVHIYAFNPSQERFPPKTGWKAPWWGHVDNEMVVQALSEGHEDEAIKTADEVNLTLPEHMKESHPEQPKAMPPGEVPAEAAKLSSQAPILKGGKELADMVFGTDTGVIPKQPPSEEMLTKLAEDPSLAKKALNQTVRMLGAAVRRLESGEAFDRLAGALQPIAKHDQKENASAGDEAPVDGSAAVPLLKEVDQVAAAANEAAEKARLWKEAEIAERNAKQAAEEAKKRVEKVTVAAAQEEAEKAIADAADGETAKDEASKEAQEADADVADKEAEVAKAEKKIEDMKKGASAEEKEDAEKELEEAKQEVKAKEEELRSAKEALENLGPDASKEEREEAEEAVEKAEAELKEAQEALERRESAVDALHVTADEEKAAEEELRRAQLAVKSAAAKAETLEKRAEEIRVKHTEGQDNALYSDSVGSDSKGVIVMGSEPKSDNEKILEAKLDAMQAKIEGLERVQLKEKLKDQLASLAEIDAVGPRKPKGVSAEPEGEGQAEEEKPTPPKKKGSWNRIAIFVTVAVLVGAVAVGALYQLMLVKRLKKGPKADKQPLTEDAAANPDLGAPAAPPATTSS